MTYLSPGELRDFITGGDPAHTVGTAATLDDTALQNHLDDAQAEVDGVLARLGHIVPLTVTAPRAVRAVVAAIASYLADLAYRHGKAHESALDPVVARYTRAQILLKAWAKGDQVIAGLPAPTSSGGGDVIVGDPINPPSIGLTDGLLDNGHGHGHGSGFGPDYGAYPAGYAWNKAHGWR